MGHFSAASAKVVSQKQQAVRSTWRWVKMQLWSVTDCGRWTRLTEVRRLCCRRRCTGRWLAWEIELEQIELMGCWVGCGRHSGERGTQFFLERWMDACKGEHTRAADH